MSGPHPAPFTPAIIDRLEELITERTPEGIPVHDPFAGTGLRLGQLCDRLGRRFSGTDLEDWSMRDLRVAVADATDPKSYPDWPHIVVTSPTYNNGVNDHFLPLDGSRRLTYRVALGRELHINNTGRYSGRSSVRSERDYWRITEAAVDCWPDTALVNVKDSIRAGDIYRLVDGWVRILEARDYEVSGVRVPCPGWRHGSNRDARVDDESILVARRL